jgi:LysR family cyn operon transcriptional activator
MLVFTIDQLRYFVEAARLEHVGRAAAALAVSPSTVSQSISNLEATIGRPLFQRIGKAIFLNTAGVAFVQRAERLLRDMTALQRDFVASDGEPAGTFRMAAEHSLSSAMGRIWVRVKKVYPRITGEIRSRDSDDVSRLIATRAVDFGLRYDLPVPNPAVEAVVVQEGGVVACVRRDHPLIRTPIAQRFQSLKFYPTAMPRAYDSLQEFESSGLADLLSGRIPELIFDNVAAAVAYVFRTDAWTILPRWVYLDLKEKFREIETPQPISSARVVATWRKDAEHATLFEQLAIRISTDLVRP